jgi:formate dehydrogenase major subunit
VNELTVPYLDPQSKTPEYKYCAIRVERIPDQVWAAAEVAKIYEQIRRAMKIPVTEGSMKKTLPKVHAVYV